MQSHEQPREVIHHQGDGALEVVWADGHRSHYSCVELRIHCPCPACLTGGPDRVRPAPPPGVRITGLEPYGNYALSLSFSDGHKDGVYRWDYLRYWCPCAACEEQRARDAGVTLPPPAELPLAPAPTGGCGSCGSAPPPSPPPATPQPLTLRPLEPR